MIEPRDEQGPCRRNFRAWRRNRARTVPGADNPRPRAGQATATRLAAIVAEVRRVRPWVVGVFILIAGMAGFRLAAGYAEGKIAKRIEQAAAAAGVRIQYEGLHVGLLPPFELTGITIEKPGKGTVRIDRAHGVATSGIGMHHTPTLPKAHLRAGVS